MGKIVILLLSLSFFSYQEKKSTVNPILEYMKWPGNEKVRTFVNVADTAEKTIINQEFVQLDDTTIQFEYFSMKEDSVPVSKSVEKYTPNTVEVVDVEFFEQNSKQKYQGYKADIIEQEYSRKHKTMIIDMEYKSKLMRDITLQMHTEIKYNYKKLDSLAEYGKEFLVIKDKSTVTLQSSKGMKDITYSIESFRIFAKGKGLIRLGSKSPIKEVFFKLKE